MNTKTTAENNQAPASQTPPSPLSHECKTLAPSSKKKKKKKKKKDQKLYTAAEEISESRDLR